MRSLPDHHVPQHASNALFLLMEIGATINKNFSLSLLTVNFPAIAPGTPYTPKRMSWMHQIDIWWSLLVWKRLKRGSFTSVADLKRKILTFIDYYNRTMAKPFKWTSQGKVLAA
jgi:hypothetical protein